MNLNNVSISAMDIEPLLRSLLIGFALSVVAIVSYSLGGNLYDSYYQDNSFAALVLVKCSIFLVAAHAISRGASHELNRVAGSWRLDLFAGAIIGGMVGHHVLQWTSSKGAISVIGVPSVAMFLAVSCIAMGAGFARLLATKPMELEKETSFLLDGEISDVKHDVLKIANKARYFAKTVADEASRGSIVFGVDGPWGIGKSSFVNLAQCVWEEDKSIIVFRFEPLKYVGEKDLVRAFVRELSGRIRSQYFAPELRPVAARYARMVKADPSVSIPGLRLSANEDSSTIDEIIKDVDDVVGRLRCRVIVVIDDLDRIEADTVNRVMFMVRRSMIAQSMAFVLVYDAERLIAKSGNESMREYFEKFVNATMPLFIDLDDLAGYLAEGWKASLPVAQSFRAQNVVAMQSILSAVADLIRSDRGGDYVGLVGNIRQIKRFINSMFMMELGDFELNLSDFDRRDLVHLMLLYQHCPGVFRDIYAAEGENRSGLFSVRSSSGPSAGYENKDEFARYIKCLGPNEHYLVSELFDAGVRKLAGQAASRDQLTTLACFNSLGRRNLAAYLRLIVRWVVPDPVQTQALYQLLLTRIHKGAEISEVLQDPTLKDNELAQSKFWSALASSARSFDEPTLLVAIDTIVGLLPSYTSQSISGQSTRSTAVYSLAMIINAAFGEVSRGNEGGVASAGKIKDLILGADRSGGLLRTLASPDRAIGGIHDMLLFRLQCCADRGNQLRNIHRALADDFSGHMSTMANSVVIEAVRLPSQIAFRIFKERYIEHNLNFMMPSDGDGGDANAPGETVVTDGFGKGFIVYQLANALPPSGSGVGCGYYDESDGADLAGISSLMNEYLFKICFVPTTLGNMLAFADHCLANFSRDYFDDAGSVPTRHSLEQGFDPSALFDFWREHGATYKEAKLEELSRRVVTANYEATYATHLVEVWRVLDESLRSVGSESDSQSSPESLAD